jgi:hypothetical protein
MARPFVRPLSEQAEAETRLGSGRQITAKKPWWSTANSTASGFLQIAFLHHTFVELAAALHAVSSSKLS